MDLQNQTAIVTGGSRGLGLGIVEALVDRGAKVTVVARTAGDLESVARRLGVGTIATDVTDRGEAERILWFTDQLQGISGLRGAMNDRARSSSVVADFVELRSPGGLKLSVNDGGARPDTVALRLAQAVRLIEELDP